MNISQNEKAKLEFLLLRAHNLTGLGGGEKLKWKYLRDFATTVLKILKSNAEVQNEEYSKNLHFPSNMDEDSSYGC